MSNNSTPIHPCPAFIAMQIKYWRKQRKLTQQKISETSGIKIRHYQEIEAGRVDMKVKTLGSIAQCLDITLHKLLKPIEQNRKKMCKKCQLMK